MNFKETFIRGGGPGGQKINKTSSTVVLRDLDTGLEVRVSQERSLTRNRAIARELLLAKIAKREADQAFADKQLAQKRLRQTRRPSAKQRAMDLEAKRRHSAKKASRRKNWDD